MLAYVLGDVVVPGLGALVSRWVKRRSAACLVSMRTISWEVRPGLGGHGFEAFDFLDASQVLQHDHVPAVA